MHDTVLDWAAGEHAGPEEVSGVPGRFFALRPTPADDSPSSRVDDCGRLCGTLLSATRAITLFRCRGYWTHDWQTERLGSSRKDLQLVNVDCQGAVRDRIQGDRVAKQLCAIRRRSGRKGGIQAGLPTVVRDGLQRAITDQ